MPAPSPWPSLSLCHGRQWTAEVRQSLQGGNSWCLDKQKPPGSAKQNRPEARSEVTVNRKPSTFAFRGAYFWESPRAPHAPWSCPAARQPPGTLMQPLPFAVPRLHSCPGLWEHPSNASDVQFSSDQGPVNQDWALAMYILVNKSIFMWHWPHWFREDSGFNIPFQKEHWCLRAVNTHPALTPGTVQSTVYELFHAFLTSKWGRSGHWGTERLSDLPRVTSWEEAKPRSKPV